MSVNHTDALDTAIGPNGEPVAIIAEKGPNGKFRLPIGSIPEYQWLDTDTPPVLDENERAFGIKINTTTHTMTVNYWTGSAWQEVA